MSERHGYHDGAPCWVELTTDDLGGAITFYSGLFGWRCADWGEELGHYTMCDLGGRFVAAISPSDAADPAWTLYLATADLDTSATRVEKGGGKLTVPPSDVPGFGRFALAGDPTGAAFGLWQAAPFFGSELYAEPGALCWAELNTGGGVTTDAFYADLFGYDQRPHGWWAGGDPVCGRLEQADAWAGWMPSFAVADCDASAAMAVEFGGEIMEGPLEGARGRVAVVGDRRRTPFTLCQVRG